MKGVNHNVQDRGKLKWTALMLSEHIQRLRAWQAEDTIPVRREPDEQQLEEWNYVITSAMEKNKLFPLNIGSPDDIRLKNSKLIA